jgi:prepilin-type N-terminal cleavage/methylation domain-containing protein
MTQNAFTLLELICVIAIIAALTSMLFPVLTTAKHAAHESVSVGRMRQLYLAQEIYRMDWEEATGSGNPYAMGLTNGPVFELSQRGKTLNVPPILFESGCGPNPQVSDRIEFRTITFSYWSRDEDYFQQNYLKLGDNMIDVFDFNCGSTAVSIDNAAFPHKGLGLTFFGNLIVRNKSGYPLDFTWWDSSPPQG